jgi:S1-C subfamily serine protease
MQPEMEPFDTKPGPRPRRFTWLLLLLLLLTAWGVRTIPPPTRFEQVQSVPPPIISATGQLADVFAGARPATLRIEGRCRNRMLGRTPVGVGTGFFISPDGQVLTAYHVVRSQAASEFCPLQYVAIDHLEREYRLELTAFDATRDLALLQARNARNVPWLQLADRLPARGSEVVAIGNSRGGFLADRAGSVLRSNVRAAQADFASGTVELTASLAPGDSGGPVLNEQGEVIGIVSYISFSSVIGGEGILPQLLRSAIGRSAYASYAVPVLAGSQQLEDLLAGEQNDVPVIGFSLQFNYVSGDQHNRALGESSGVVVGSVQPGSPAERAGLRSYRTRPVISQDGNSLGMSVEADVIIRIDGQATPDFTRLMELVRHKQIGSVITLSVQRGREVVELPVELAPYRAVFR